MTPYTVKAGTNEPIRQAQKRKCCMILGLSVQDVSLFPQTESCPHYRSGLNGCNHWRSRQPKNGVFQRRFSQNER